MKILAAALVALASLSLSLTARADLVCSDALATATEPHDGDELPHASATLFYAYEGCACGSLDYGTSPPTAIAGACSSACSFTDGSQDWGCGITAPVCDPAIDPACDYATYYSWTQAQADDCAACVASLCSTERDACAADGS